jgi:hypothetical protein
LAIPGRLEYLCPGGCYCASLSVQIANLDPLWELVSIHGKPPALDYLHPSLNL